MTQQRIAPAAGDARTAGTGTRTGRRGILAAAAATLAALAAGSAAEPSPVAADGGAWTFPYNGTLATDSTLVQLINTATGLGLFATSSSNYGVYGSTGASAGSAVAGVFGYGYNSGTYGVQGGTSSGYGVYGYSSANGIGVVGLGYSSVGVLANSTTGAGVYATSGSSYGVFGNSGSNTGVFGTSNSGIAVNGQSQTGPGVRGTTAAGSSDDGGRFLADKGRGVAGFSNSGQGVQGNCTAGGYAVVGNAGAGAVAALYGSSVSANTPAFAAYNGAAGGLAGTFNGNVYITGNYTATGTKSAAVPHPDGSHRLLYCLEAPEAWFEDFGEGTLTAGKTEVKLDPDFAAVIDTSTLHVFCMPHDTTHHLAVTTRTASGFSVGADVDGLAPREIKAADVNGTFTWRVVAKRKDVAAPRLAKIDLPKIPPPPPTPPAEPLPKLSTPAAPPMPPLPPIPKLPGAPPTK